MSICEAAVEIKCDVTGKAVRCKVTAKGNPKLPRGWKWYGDKAVSAEAWHDLYCLRAITVPVVSPAVDGNAIEMKAAWKILDEQLREAWAKSTEAANWAVKRLWANDVTRQNDVSKCPKMPEIYLYGERDWAGWSQSAGAALRAIEQSYRAKRFEIVWTGSAGVPNVRYPYPYPLHNASWGLEQDKGGSIVFDCRLPSGRVAMRLRTKDKSGRYRMSALQHLMTNPELRGEAAIIKKRDGTISIKMVGWFPKTVREQSGELRVRTDTASFLVMLNEKDERILTFNGDRIRRLIVAHANGLQRMREDMKFEVRQSKSKVTHRLEDMQAACKKRNDRVDSFLKETCAQIVGHAVRRKLETVRYDDSEKSYFRDFPWDRMKTTLEQVCNRENVSFEWSGAAKKAATSRKIVTSTEKVQ